MNTKSIYQQFIGEARRLQLNPIAHLVAIDYIFPYISGTDLFPMLIRDIDSIILPRFNGGLLRKQPLVLITTIKIIALMQVSNTKEELDTLLRKYKVHIQKNKSS